MARLWHRRPPGPPSASRSTPPAHPGRLWTNPPDTAMTDPAPDYRAMLAVAVEEARAGLAEGGIGAAIAAAVVISGKLVM